MKIQLRDEKILPGLKNFDLKITLTGRRLPLVWSPSKTTQRPSLGSSADRSGWSASWSAGKSGSKISFSKSCVN